MPRGSLGESSDQDSFYRPSERISYSTRTTAALSPIQNPYEKPTTSSAARQRGELQMTRTQEIRRQELSSMPARGAARRKPKSGRRRLLADLNRIVKLQKTTKLLIPRAPFARVVREISMEISQDVTHYTQTALEALHEATEMYLTQVLQDAYMLTLHRKCITLSVSDMVLIRALKFNI